MRDKALNAINRFSMLSYGDKVVVALSGGADSVALLYLLNSIKEELNLTIYACHLNHMIRGAQADSDEKFVTNLCDKLCVELFVKKVDVSDLAKQKKQSLELCGRNARYEFFCELAQKLEAKVATAHTASDNVETVLYNIARGTGVTGLCGIKPVRDCYIRPLIYCSRADVERYCEENSLEFVTDSTNLCDDYTRNKIRHHCVPVLSEINFDLCTTVNRMCDNMRVIASFIDEYSIKELSECEVEHGYSCQKLQQLDTAVFKNCLYIIANKSGVDVTSRHIDLMADAVFCDGCVDLPDDKRCVCKQGVLRIVSKSNDECDFCMPLSEYEFAQYISAEEIKNINKKLLNNCINCDIITDNTVIRTKKEGDTFTFFDRGVTKSVKKLLNELKVPAEKRCKLLLVANGSTVLWLQGVGTSKHGRVNKDSSLAVMITGGTQC